MDDLISRQDAIDAMRQYAHYDDFDVSVVEEDIAVIALKDLPSIPERKGRWIGKDDDSERYDSYWCDQCHHEITVDAKRFCDIGFVIEDFKFCPHCGAKMEGAEDDPEEN